MFKFLKSFFTHIQKKSEKTIVDAQMLRMIQLEYRNDWEHVYYMYKEGKLFQVNY